VVAIAALGVGDRRARADASDQVWPKLSLYLQLSDRTRVELLAQSQIATGSGAINAQAGGELEISMAPLRERLFPTVQLSKKERATLGLGYRGGAPIVEGDKGGVREHRFLAEATFRVLFPATILASDRNRFEARWLDGDWSWRYRNRLRVERGFDAGAARLIPFASGELFYDSRSDGWSRLRVEAGLDIEELTGRRSVIELYVARQFDASGSFNALGLTFELYR
jgi:hypothetical protein